MPPAPTRVLLGRKYTDEVFLGLVLAGAMFPPVGAIGVLAGTIDGPRQLVILGAGCLAVGAAGAVAAWLRYVHIRDNRAWLDADDGRLRLTDRDGPRDVSDEITDIAVSERVVDADGRGGVPRRRVIFTVPTNGETRAHTVEQFLPPGRPDPFGPAWDAAVNRVAARTWAAVQRGDPLAGDGWGLTRSGLTVTTPAGTTEVPLGRISAVEWVEDGISVWAAGEAEPFLRRRARDPRATVLFRVLEDRPAAPTEPPAARAEMAGGLGRVVFSKASAPKPERVREALVVLAVAAFLAIGLVVYAPVNKFARGGPPVAALAAGGILVVCVAGGWTLFARCKEVFRCHEAGVVHTTWRGTRTLRFDEIGAFTYSGTRQFVNDAYVGTELRMRFEPFAGGAARPIGYRVKSKFREDELDGLRDHVSTLIAGHMLRRLSAGETVPWTARLRFRPDGLEIDALGRVVPYRQLGRYDIREGQFLLSARGSDDWDVREPVNQRNFFPGFALLLAVLAAPPATPSA